MNQYSFLSLIEPPAARRARYLRLALVFCLTLGAAIAFGQMWRRYQPNESHDLYQDLIDGVIAAVVSVIFGESSKGKTEKLRRDFRLTIDSETISRKSPPLKLARNEIKGVYLGPFHSLWITSIDRRRKIIVPGELEQRENVLRDLIAMGLPSLNFSDWLTDFVLARVVAVAVLGAASFSIVLPGPAWHLEIGSAVLLAGFTWYGIRVGGDPNVEHIGLERFLVVLAALGVLWRDAHVLFGIWP